MDVDRLHFVWILGISVCLSVFALSTLANGVNSLGVILTCLSSTVSQWLKVFLLLSIVRNTVLRQAKMSHNNSAEYLKIAVSKQPVQHLSCFASNMADNAQDPQADQPKTKNQIKNEEKKKEKLAKLAAKQAKVNSQPGTPAPHQCSSCQTWSLMLFIPARCSSHWFSWQEEG